MAEYGRGDIEKVYQEWVSDYEGIKASKDNEYTTENLIKRMKEILLGQVNMYYELSDMSKKTGNLRPAIMMYDNAMATLAVIDILMNKDVLQLCNRLN